VGWDKKIEGRWKREDGSVQLNSVEMEDRRGKREEGRKKHNLLYPWPFPQKVEAF
jgi:hypothetical protein